MNDFQNELRDRRGLQLPLGLTVGEVARRVILWADSPEHQEYVGKEDLRNALGLQVLSLRQLTRALGSAFEYTPQTVREGVPVYHLGKPGWARSRFEELGRSIPGLDSEPPVWMQVRRAFAKWARSDYENLIRYEVFREKTGLQALDNTTISHALRAVLQYVPGSASDWGLVMVLPDRELVLRRLDVCGL